MPRSRKPQWQHEGVCYSPSGPLMGFYRGGTGEGWYYSLGTRKEVLAKSRAQCIREIEKNKPPI